MLELTEYGRDGEVSGYSTLSQIIGEAGRANPGLALGAAFFDAPQGGRSVAQDLVAWDGEKGPHDYNNVARMFGYDKTMCDPVQAISTLMDKPEGLDSESVNSVLRTADKARMERREGILGI